MSSLGRAGVIAVLAALAAIAGGGAAAASAPEPAPTSDDAASVPGEIDNLEDLLPVATDVEAGPQLPADLPALTSLATAKGGAASVSPLATGCWTQRWTWSPRSGVGTVLYTYYHVGYWCSSGTRVTAARVAAAGGETRTPGWSYNGVVDRGAGIAANQGRSFSQHKFTLRAGGIVVQSPLQCGRVKGAASGGASADRVCGIY